MIILVTGGQGQVGSALAAQGLEQGLDLVALSRSELASICLSDCSPFDRDRSG